MNVAPDIYAADGVTTSKGVRGELDASPDGSISVQTITSTIRNISLYGNYSLTLAEDHNIVLMAGYQEENNKVDYLKNAISGLYSMHNPNTAMGTGDKQPDDIRNGWATRGFFGRINYDSSGSLLARSKRPYDGSSRFARDHRWSFFPSVSLGWNISREKSMGAS